MPIYTKQCTDCQETFDVVCSISSKDTHVATCPSCHSTVNEYRPTASSFTMRSERLMTHKRSGATHDALKRVADLNPGTPLAKSYH